MASHRPSQSISVPATSHQKQQRRMTSPAPPAQLNLPEAVGVAAGRPPSPLRHGFTSGDDSESDEEQDARWADNRPSSPSSSLSIASIAQAVGSLVGVNTPRNHRPTNAEIEAEAERERDQSRMEAEWILTQEAEQRRVVEQRKLAVMQTNRSQQSSPSRSQTTANPPSPAVSQKDSSWWAAAKNKLTPTKEKEPLTPAQQIIQETKTRDQAARKSEEQLRKSGEREWRDTEKRVSSKGKEREWPASPETKFNDPAFLNLAAPPRTPGQPSSPTSPTPARPQNLSHYSSNLSNFSPSPLRSGGEPSSPAAPPLYAEFNPQGTLDMPGTLLTIARRFEKLEKWTVGHVRALEERMSDVERWLVDKEKEKEANPPTPVKSAAPAEDHSRLVQDVEELQGRVGELGREMQGRFGELGREMAKLATAPGNLVSGPSKSAEVVRPQMVTTSSFVQPDETPSPPASVHPPPLHHRISSSTAFSETTSPPLASRGSTSRSARLPYPSGDYAPPDTMSPPISPQPVKNTSTTRPLSIVSRSSSGISGLPSPSNLPASSSSGLPAPDSNISSSISGLPPPPSSSSRQSSMSPTPRKRYTVALGGPIVDPNEAPKYDAFPRPPSTVGTAIFSSSPTPASSQALDDYSSADDTDDESTKKKYQDASAEFADETIGKSAARSLSSRHRSPDFSSNGAKHIATTPTPKQASPRVRAQSAYGMSSFVNMNSKSSYGSLLQQPTTTHTPTRSRSTDRFSLNLDGVDVPGGGSGKFIDPLVLRRMEKDGANGGTKKVMPGKGNGKLPVGQLVAFFDQST